MNSTMQNISKLRNQGALNTIQVKNTVPVLIHQTGNDIWRKTPRYQ